MLKKKFQVRGMRGRALKLIRNYLYERFIQVVNSQGISKALEILSGVPQGGKWSTDFWNFDANEIDKAIKEGILFCYADDNAVFYEITEENRPFICQLINTELQALFNWGVENKTTFEPTKSFAQVFSRKSNPFDPYGFLFFGGHELEVVDIQKVVGYTLDSKLTWTPMIETLAKKARLRLAALTRLRTKLDADNLRTMYVMFVRSILEYGNIAYLSAAPSSLAKLDRVQAVAERLGDFTLESLQSRREAAVIKFTLKLLDGAGRGVLKHFTPAVETVRYTDAVSSGTRGKARGSGLQIRVPRPARPHSLDLYKRGFWGCLPKIWLTLPQSLVKQGAEKGWRKIGKQCAKFITLGILPEEKVKKQLNPNAQPFIPSLVVDA